MLAEVYFRTYEDRQRAKDKIYDDCGGSVYGETSGSSDRPYGLYIYDECQNVSRMRQICDANDGQFVK